MPARIASARIPVRLPLTRMPLLSGDGSPPLSASDTPRPPSARTDLQPIEVLAHRVAKALTARHSGATGEHQDEITARRAADLPHMVDVHEAGAADAQHGLRL